MKAASLHIIPSKNKVLHPCHIGMQDKKRCTILSSDGAEMPGILPTAAQTVTAPKRQGD